MVSPERCLRYRGCGVVNVDVDWVEWSVNPVLFYRYLAQQTRLYPESKFCCLKSNGYTLGLGHFVITVDASGKI